MACALSSSTSSIGVPTGSPRRSSCCAIGSNARSATATGSWSGITIRGAADTLVWLDLPFPLVIWRLFWRTLRRSVSQENLWGSGNTESLVRSFFTRQSILLYAMKTHGRNRRRFAVDTASYGKGKKVVRLDGAREVERFLAAA
jgi:hypothetical protein